MPEGPDKTEEPLYLGNPETDSFEVALSNGRIFSCSYKTLTGQFEFKFEPTITVQKVLGSLFTSDLTQGDYSTIDWYTRQTRGQLRILFDDYREACEHYQTIKQSSNLGEKELVAARSMKIRRAQNILLLSKTFKEAGIVLKSIEVTVESELPSVDLKRLISEHSLVNQNLWTQRESDSRLSNANAA